MLGMIGGLKIIEDNSMVDISEDWSRVRSPSRAKRRRAKGHPQNIVVTYTPKEEVFKFEDKLIMHPIVAHALRRHHRETENLGGI